MIDRSYLPISRHVTSKTGAWPSGLASSSLSIRRPYKQTSSLSKSFASSQTKKSVTSSSRPTSKRLLSPLSTLQENQVAVYYGQVYTLSPSEVLIKNGHHYHSLLLSTIFSIEPGDSSYETSPE